MVDYKIGLDIGSTTIKIAVLDKNNFLIYNEYKRHLTDIKNTLKEIISSCYNHLGDAKVSVCITGSGGLSVSKWMDLPFEQEVITCTKAVEANLTGTEIVIELGGEDAKITYLKNGTEQRMNNSCAGGTGAFIDQMAALLCTDAKGINEYAKNHSVIYPIASRCGVFAKSDIQPLLNDGARKEDISASILQAVVNQTIGGLSCGKPIKGKVVFLGGPFYFLSELRKRFRETLNLTKENSILPEHALVYPAIGAALLAEKLNQSRDGITLEELSLRTERLTDKQEKSWCLPPLFTDEFQYEAFKKRHSNDRIKRVPLSNYKGKAYLGMDAGSTTLKAVLIGENREVLYEYYGGNEGDPAKMAAFVLQDIYNSLPEGVTIYKSAVTGYGEEFMRAAFHFDIGEIETVAHYKAAEFVLPGVDFILDIGGQDMKCLRINNGTIESILLNEACSSGCGSFLESFAASMHIDIKEFAKLGLYAKSPVDLGTKCTVFMNSKVKQAQKEGFTIGDLSAGLSYSVIKNALYKVIKIRDEKDMGSKMIVQGGTFYNDAVLRCFELVSHREVVRPSLAGLMGAFGAALLARDYEENTCKESELIKPKYLQEFKVITKNERCDKCTNHCLLTTNTFKDEGKHITGNRCEKGLGLLQSHKQSLPNLYDYKYKRLFSYKPLKEDEAYRGVIGIPRALNMFENYPFWFTMLTKLGFRVILSSPSNKKLYEKGLETIPSDSVCYPAKLCHGHIVNLLEKGIQTIFYPSVVYEKREYEEADNHFNCPIVISYAEVIKNNIESLNHIRYIAPFVTMNQDDKLCKAILEAFSSYQVTQKEVKAAVMAARNELNAFKEEIRLKGEETLKYLKAENKKAIVLCGKPYHVDPEINHGIPELINAYDYAVLTEDSISHLMPLTNKLRVVDQWAYNSRIYRAAQKVASTEQLELIQLNSFGCGLDSVTSDQLIEILSETGKLFTLLKIDEGTNLGAARIRIRSLKAAVDERDKKAYKPVGQYKPYVNTYFTKEAKKTHTILAPQMAPIHFELIQEASRSCGYHLEILSESDQGAIEEGLKYVNNDACYPAILLIGQIVNALKSGKYDLNATSVILTQTGGGCRATNYMSFLKLGLKTAGFENIPLISLNAVGLGEQPGFKLSVGFINRLVMAVIYGDLFMKLLYGTRPYEKIKGQAEKLYLEWNLQVKKNIWNGKKREFDRNVQNIIKEFDYIEVFDVKKPKIAIVGEILAKYHPMANAGIIKTLEEGGAEVVLPDLMDFFLYSLYNSDFKAKYLEGKSFIRNISQIGMKYLDHYRKTMFEELGKSKRFTPPPSIKHLANKAANFLSLGNQTGEGWLITAEMVDCIENGIPNILCVQPLACLPNHITGRGMFKPLKDKYPGVNIMPIDYDPGISYVNQMNRVKLMLSVALKNNEEVSIQETKDVSLNTLS